MLIFNLTIKRWMHTRPSELHSTQQPGLNNVQCVVACCSLVDSFRPSSTSTSFVSGTLLSTQGHL